MNISIVSVAVVACLQYLNLSFSNFSSLKLGHSWCQLRRNGKHDAHGHASNGRYDDAFLWHDAKHDDDASDGAHRSDARQNHCDLDSTLQNEFPNHCKDDFCFTCVV
eukprot:1634534-Amphidinium_carterae.1